MIAMSTESMHAVHAPIVRLAAARRHKCTSLLQSAYIRSRHSTEGIEVLFRSHLFAGLVARDKAASVILCLRLPIQHSPF
jgi:hypothetical protein